jgi:Ca2+-binding EF-hand superfamily protein
MNTLLSLMCILMMVGCASPQGNRPFAKRKQAMNDAQKRFQAVDVDDNGSLSRDEFAKSQAAKRVADPDKLFNSADTNGDGLLTFSELTEAIRKLQSNRQ